jgi:hypothetical protein
MATFKELLEKVTDPELKASMLEEFNRVNQENGERGRKLIEKDGELNTAKAKVSKVSEYESAFRLLQETGAELKDIPAMLEKLKIVQTTEDENKVMKALLKDEQAKAKALEKEVTTFKVRGAIDGVFNEERKNFKTETGEAITVVDDFIDKTKLYGDINLDNPVLLKERANSVLKDAYQQQESILAKIGFQGSPVHKVIEGNAQPGQNLGAMDTLRSIAKTEGAASAMSEFLNSQKG